MLSFAFNIFILCCCCHVVVVVVVVNFVVVVAFHDFSVSEIKGAPCTRRAHFDGRVHDFRRCAPGVVTFLSHLLLLYIGRVHGAISGCIVL